MCVLHGSRRLARLVRDSFWQWRLRHIRRLLPLLLASIMMNSAALAGGRLDIIGHDDRVPLPATMRDLEESVGLLVYRRRDPKTGKWRTSSCTAACVSPRLLLTAAHCVMGVRDPRDRTRKGEVDLGRMVFILKPRLKRAALKLRLAGDGDAQRREMMRAGPGNTRFFDGNHAIDWAILPLSPLTPCRRPLPVTAKAVDAPALLRRTAPLLLVGFHSDKMQKKDFRLHISRCHATRARKFRLKPVRLYERRVGRRMLLHFCDFTSGASGSPILFVDGINTPGITAVVSGQAFHYLRRRNLRTGRVIGRGKSRINTAAPAVNFIKAFESMREQFDDTRPLAARSPHDVVQMITPAGR